MTSCENQQYLEYRTIVQINSQTRRSNSSQWSSKTIISILLLSVVLFKPIHAMTFRTKFLLFASICVPPNNPITACGATSFPGYHPFPKWAITAAKETSSGDQLKGQSAPICGAEKDWHERYLRASGFFLL